MLEAEQEQQGPQADISVGGAAKTHSVANATGASSGADQGQQVGHVPHGLMAATEVTSGAEDSAVYQGAVAATEQLLIQCLEAIKASADRHVSVCHVSTRVYWTRNLRVRRTGGR